MGVLKRLYNTVAEMTTRLDDLSGRSLDDWVVFMAVLHALQVQAQALLDMVTRLAAELGYAPSSPREAAEILKTEGLLGKDEYKLVKSIIGFRNILVHGYASVDENLVKEILAGKTYRRLTMLASSLLERAAAKGIDP